MCEGGGRCWNLKQRNVQSYQSWRRHRRTFPSCLGGSGAPQVPGAPRTGRGDSSAALIHNLLWWPEEANRRAVSRPWVLFGFVCGRQPRSSKSFLWIHLINSLRLAFSYYCIWKVLGCPRGQITPLLSIPVFSSLSRLNSTHQNPLRVLTSQHLPIIVQVLIFSYHISFKMNKMCAWLLYTIETIWRN